MHDGYDTVIDVRCFPPAGQKRLIALARCLLRCLEVLLLDEPTENLDADQRAWLTGVIRGYARDRTCMVISHDMDFTPLSPIGSLVLEDGRIVQSGSPRAHGRGRSRPNACMKRRTPRPAEVLLHANAREHSAESPSSLDRSKVLLCLRWIVAAS